MRLARLTRRAALLAATAVAVPAGACGVVTTDPLRASYHPSQTPDCSSSAGALALDVGGAASLAAVEAITLRNAVTDDYARGHDVRDTGIELAGTVAVALQQMLQDNLGIELDVVRKVFASVAEFQTEAEAQEGGVIFRLSFGASLYDPSFIGNVVRSDSSGIALQYSNPDMDALIAEADAELDEDRRCELYTQIDQMMGDEAVFLAPFRGTSTWFFKQKVRGIKIVNQRVWHSMHEAYIAVD